MSEELLRENLRELKLRYSTMRRERDDLMAANVLVSQEIDALKAENARLRAALEKIAPGETVEESGCNSVWEQFQAIRDIARSALAP